MDKATKYLCIGGALLGGVLVIATTTCRPAAAPCRPPIVVDAGTDASPPADAVDASPPEDAAPDHVDVDAACRVPDSGPRKRPPSSAPVCFADVEQLREFLALARACACP